MNVVIAREMAVVVSVDRKPRANANGKPRITVRGEPVEP
jgi:hypothetical protein